MSSKGNRYLIHPHLKQPILLFNVNKNKTPDKALVAACIINEEKCENKLTPVRWETKTIHLKIHYVRSFRGVSDSLKSEHMVSQTPALQTGSLQKLGCCICSPVCIGLWDKSCASPYTADHSSVDAREGARFAKPFWQGPSLLYSQSPKVAEYPSSGIRIPHVKGLNGVNAASTELCGFQGASWGGLVKSLAVSQEKDKAITQHVNSEALLVCVKNNREVIQLFNLIHLFQNMQKNLRM